MSESTGTYYFPFYCGSKRMPYRVKAQRQIMYTTPRQKLRRIPQPIPQQIPRPVPQQVVEQITQPVIEPIQVEYYQIQPSYRVLRDSPRHKKTSHVEEEYPKETICSMS